MREGMLLCIIRRRLLVLLSAGFLAHRGIGVVSTKYGKIDDMVLQMQVVLPNGDIIETSPAPKHAAGPDLNQILSGLRGRWALSLRHR